MGIFDEIHPVQKPLSVKKVKDASGRNRLYVTGDCTICGEPFEKRKDGAKHSDLCHPCARKQANAERQGKILEYRRKGKIKKCPVCESEFYVTPNRAMSAKYCSNKCQGTAQAEKITKSIPDNSGKKNGRYKDGKRVGERENQNTPKNKVRKQVIERDGNWCLLCGKPPKGLHLHRVVYGSQGGEYEKGNCVQLCNIHHGLVHSDKKTFQPLLEHYLKLATDRQVEGEPTEPPDYWHEWIDVFRKEVE